MPDEVATEEIFEKEFNHVLNNDLENEAEQCSTINITKQNDKPFGSNQIQEFEEEYQNPELSRISNINTRYQFNSENYIQELHNALIKESNYNLLNYTSLNATLDSESISSVTYKTLQAVKV